jgi:hypothetical protein
LCCRTIHDFSFLDFYICDPHQASGVSCLRAGKRWSIPPASSILIDLGSVAQGTARLISCMHGVNHCAAIAQLQLMTACSKTNSPGKVFMVCPPCALVPHQWSWTPNALIPTNSSRRSIRPSPVRA